MDRVVLSDGFSFKEEKKKGNKLNLPGRPTQVRMMYQTLEGV